MAEITSSSLISEETRKIRSKLLVTSLIGFAFSQIGLVLNKVSLLGTEFGIERVDMIPIILGIIVLYYLVIFITYSWSDRVKHQDQLYHGGSEKAREAGLSERLELEDQKEILKQQLEMLQNKKGKASSNKALNLIYETEIMQKELEMSKIKHQLYVLDYEVRSSGVRNLSPLIRSVLEIIFPLVIAVYVIVLLFFFTSISEVNTAQP